ncbi:hypothetical protein MSC49_28450 [Methylosinus sp. C49]|uniref:helix-turn-helix transcriptional regulator n=1 Tax=Methylosinus sp. C49 TaxID=2699395 RepID=UPI001366DE5C|nr:helix-turn-helix transcriptional regulator [Methylosinus sp. C49]BBU62910.1 hypothetical protein MSC49_28450 [Methylosinus sp. C49]
MKNLKVIRERHGLTQSELAKRIGTTQQTIARWESGKAEPSLAALRDLAVCLWTSVDQLLGRKPMLQHQNTNPFTWISGDKSGYWGNIGIHLPSRDHSIWYPISISTMEQVFAELQSVEPGTWISFQTLNNKMVVVRPSQALALTFLDEAEDSIEGDWEVGPDDVEGWPEEVYACLNHLIWDELGDQDSEDEFSETLISVGKSLIEEHKLDSDKLKAICLETRIVYNSGATRKLYASPERLASAMFDFDLGVEHTGSKMLHLDDEGGDHSVFLSLDLISLLEFPLLELKKGLEQEIDELNDDDEPVDGAGEKGAASQAS